MKLLTQQFLRSSLLYDENTGLFIRRVNAGGQKAGVVAGTVKPAGHVEVSVGGHIYKAHRLAWFYVNGKWPKGLIDHINGIRSDNRIKNLRDVSDAVNQQNRRRALANSISGILVVSID